MQPDPARLHLAPCTVSDACAFVAQHHRHHRPPRGGLFAVGVAVGDDVVGVAVIGRPVARGLQDGWTAEVTRLCVVNEPRARHACSMLYGAAWRAARALGYRKLVTYILSDEPGTSLRAAGWHCVGETRGGSWTRPSRPRVDRHPTQAKLRWERTSGDPDAA